MKKCNNCNEEKNLDQFYKHNGGLKKQCIKCYRDKQRESYTPSEIRLKCSVCEESIVQGVRCQSCIDKHLIPEIRVCRTCNEEQNINNFPKTGKDRKRGITCKVCIYEKYKSNNTNKVTKKGTEFAVIKDYAYYCRNSGMSSEEVTENVKMNNTYSGVRTYST